jgi:uncharacterized protein YutD
MEINTVRKYNSIFRKKLVSKFEKIKCKSELLDIYNIIVEDIGNDFSTNQNGIFVNMNILSDKCIKKLIDYIEDRINLSATQTDTEKVNYKTYKLDEIENISENGIKLSNQEKNIIKKIRDKS